MFSILGLVLMGCGSGGPAATPLPAATWTPRAAPLPTVPSPVPFGSKDRPFQIVLVPAPESSATGTSLRGFFEDRTGQTFKVNIVSSQADVLSALCGSEGVFAWVDGWTLMAAIQRGCGEPLLQIERDGATGIRSDIVISPASQLASVTALRNWARTHDICRMNAQDVVSWILPVMLMRTARGLEPLTEFKTIRDYNSVEDMLADVSDNKCVGAIQSGTLTNYEIPGVSDITKTIKVLGTTPELPYGGLMISSAVPNDVADQIASALQKNVDVMKDYITVDALKPASVDDFEELRRVMQNSGFDLDLLGK